VTSSWSFVLQLVIQPTFHNKELKYTLFPKSNICFEEEQIPLYRLVSPFFSFVFIFLFIIISFLQKPNLNLSQDLQNSNNNVPEIKIFAHFYNA